MRWLVELIRARACESLDIEVEACDGSGHSVLLPKWPTDQLQRVAGDAAPSAGTPLVIVGKDKNRRIVVAADAAERAVGLRAGTVMRSITAALL